MLEQYAAKQIHEVAGSPLYEVRFLKLFILLVRSILVNLFDALTDDPEFRLQATLFSTNTRKQNLS